MSGFGAVLPCPFCMENIALYNFPLQNLKDEVLSDLCFNNWKFPISSHIFVYIAWSK
jgi:hypothetical protein